MKALLKASEAREAMKTGRTGGPHDSPYYSHKWKELR
jgi:hypothetical protein